MNQKHSYETMVEAIRLVEGGFSLAQAAEKVGVSKPNVKNWVATKRRTGRLPILKHGGGRGLHPAQGYIPQLRVGMESYELLSPEVLAEFKRRQVLKLFKVIEGELGEIN